MYKTLGDFNVTLPPGLIQTTVTPESAATAAQASIASLVSSPLVWVLTGLLAVMVFRGTGSRGKSR